MGIRGQERADHPDPTRRVNRIQGGVNVFKVMVAYPRTDSKTWKVWAAFQLLHDAQTYMAQLLRHNPTWNVRLVHPKA